MAASKKFRIGASELAKVSKNVSFELTSLDWWKTFTKIGVRSFGYDGYIAMIGVDQQMVISASGSEEECQIIVDERKVEQDIAALKESAVYKKMVDTLQTQAMTTSGVIETLQTQAAPSAADTQSAQAEFYALVDEIQADPRAVGIVVEASRAEAGILKKNNSRAYGKDYVHPASKKDPPIVHLFAYVDGENEDGSLIEEKTRKYKGVYDRPVPIYELIQMAVILYTTERETIHHTQHYREETRTETFSRSDLMPYLHSAMKVFLITLRLTDFAEKFRTELTDEEKNDVFQYAGTL